MKKRGVNRFELDSKCNSMIGYCVEYYSKYLVYGREYLEAYIERAMYKKGRYYTDEECLIVRACMLKYIDDMTKSFGIGVSSVIKVRQKFAGKRSEVTDCGIELIGLDSKMKSTVWSA